MKMFLPLNRTRCTAVPWYRYRNYTGEEAVGTGVGMTSSDKRGNGVNQTPGLSKKLIFQAAFSIPRQ